MAEFDTRIQQKSDTQVNFESNNPILLQNELVIVKMTDGSIKFKVGDGTSHFNSLQYTDIYLINNLNTKANINSPNFTGTPTAPTQINTDNSTKLATTAFVQSVASPINNQVSQNTSNISNLNSTVAGNTSSINSINSTLNTKANINSPNFTGNPTAPTQASSDNSTKLATTAFVQTVIQSAGGGGTEIILSSSQPSGQAEGSIWFRQL